MICPWTIYLCYNDRKILEDHYDSMKCFMDYLGKERALGFIRNHPDLNLDKLGWVVTATATGSRWTEAARRRHHPYDLIARPFTRTARTSWRRRLIFGPARRREEISLSAWEIVDAFRHRYITAEGLVVSARRPPTSRAPLRVGAGVSPRRAPGNSFAISRSGITISPPDLSARPTSSKCWKTRGISTSPISFSNRRLSRPGFSRSGTAPRPSGTLDADAGKGIPGQGHELLNHYAYGAVGRGCTAPWPS